jgi:DNA polymerase-3 subunit delta
VAAKATAHPDQLASAPVVLLTGSDAVLVEDAVVGVVHELLGDGDRSLVVDEWDAARLTNDDGELELGRLVDAAQTPPFLTEHRIVVGRQLGGFTRADQVTSLVAYLADPLSTTRLVLVWDKDPRPNARSGRPPKSVLDAVATVGGVVRSTDAGSGKELGKWLDEQLATSGLRLDAEAKALVLGRIGEDASLVVGLLPTLEGVYGAGARLGAADVEPYLGEEGSVKPWDLTDAIDAGDVSRAVDSLHRMLSAGDMHPLQVMALLHNHYGRMLALDGSGAADERSAAELLGLKGSTYPARKALDMSRRLGSDRLREFTALLARADLDLRGARAWPPELVVEVLVARLASRGPGRRRVGAAR